MVRAYTGETVSVRNIHVDSNRRYWTFQDLQVGPFLGSSEIGVGGGETVWTGAGYIGS